MLGLKWPVNCYKMRFLYTSLPFACLYVVCGTLFCDDHQPCWCEHMWEPLAVVMLIRMLQLDGLDRVGPTVGTTTGRFYVVYVVIVEKGLVLLFVFFQYISGWAMWGPFCCNLGMFNVLYTFTPIEVSFIEVIQLLGMLHQVKDF